MPHATRFALAALVVLALAALSTSAMRGADAANRAYTVYLSGVSCASCEGTLPDPTRLPSPMPVPVTSTPEPSVYAARMIELVNEARVAAGCPAAIPHDALMRGAQAWSEKMDREGIYDHTIGGYYEDFGYTFGPLENIGSGDTPEFALDRWMESALHKRNLEWCYHPDNPSYRPDDVYDIGVGYMDGYWTLAIGTHTP